MRALKLPLAIGAVAIAACCLAPEQAVAGWMGPGCWVCKEEGHMLNEPEYRCDMVGHEEQGTGTSCWEGALPDAYFCYTNNDPCFNVVVPGGGGGGGGTGGGTGGGCTVPQGAACPAWCASCDRILY